ncbi:MAG: TDG/mug DNA glycosylase family protein [Pirellulaceae bacterium]|jgi:TDG/mug DNA glycosylase family protein
MKPTKQQLIDAENHKLRDVISSHLDVLFVGINPSVYSTAVGHHFARPGNRFWPALHIGGFTPRQLSPFEDYLLPDFGCGLTNVASRTTARADHLDVDELERGGRGLIRKVSYWKPKCVAFLGVTSYRTAFARPHAVIGQQEELIASRPIWVLPNPSGLNAHFQLPDFKGLFAQLRNAVSC